jgi:integrase
MMLMAVFARGKTYFYEFQFDGKRYRGTTKVRVGKGVPGQPNPKERAKQIENAKRMELALADAGLKAPAETVAAAEIVLKPFFRDYSIGWLSTYAKVHCKHATHRLYTQVVEDHLNPVLGSKRIDAISRNDVRLLIAAKIEQKLSKSTVRNIVAPLREMLGHAVDDGLIVSNPATRLARFSKETSARANAQKILPYTPEEVNALLDRAATKNSDLHVFLLVAVLTGMRLGELVGLQWPDIDPIAKCVHVKRAVSRRRVETPKNHLIRRIDLSDDLLRALQQMETRRKQEWLEKGKAVPEWVFCNEEGSFMNEFNFRTRKFYPLFKKEDGVGAALQLRRIRLHDLRHTYASLMLQQGESITYVKEQMGHHSIQVTVDLYGHLIPGANRAAANRLHATIGRRGKGAAASA